MGITNVTFQIWPFRSVISLCICCTFFLSTGYSVVSFTLSSTLLLPSFDNHEDCHSSTTGFHMSLHLIPLGKYKEARLPKDTVCLVFSNTDRLSSQVAQPSFVLMNDAVLATPQFYLHLLIWLLESQRCRGQLTHTFAMAVFLRQGFTMNSWLAWPLPAHGFQLSCNQINCLLFCISYDIYFSLCVQSCMEATGQLQDQLLPSTLRSQDSRRVRVVFMCSPPQLGYLPKLVGLQ